MEDEDDYEKEIDLNFFRVFSKYRLPAGESFILPIFFNRKVTTVTLKVVSGSRMTTAITFSRQNDAGSRARTTYY